MNISKLTTDLITALIAAFIVFVIPAPVFAQTMTTHSSEIVLEDVKLSDTVKLDDHGITHNLKKVSDGIRKKKAFGLVTVKVYITELFAENSEKLKLTEDQIINSLPQAQAIQIKLTMLRNLSGKDITKSFKEALKINKIDVENPSEDLVNLITEIEAIDKIKSGESFSITGTWKANQETLYLQFPDQTIKSIKGQTGFIQKVFSIWLGEPADDFLKTLKKSLLKL